MPTGSRNRLAGESSPYLVQHAGNPVDWYPWGEEALRRAREERRPILLSIGYSACHWCHVMERESFEDPETAELMNQHFVNIKVDREERPDLDAVYMDAVISLTGQGGWPMTVFLTPDAEPFFAGTYFPPDRRYGMPSFRDVLGGVAEGWRDRRELVEESAGTIAEHLRSLARVAPAAQEPGGDLLAAAVDRLGSGFDAEWGGWGSAPKFPAASTLEFLLRRGEREMAGKTLDAMAAGGMYDLVGGGFHRYSVDERWLVPHFEKMLYDNAQLAVCYLHGWLALGVPRFRLVAEQTVEYMLRELLLDGGGFASAQDADTAGIEGLTFTWAPGEGAPDGILQPFEDGRYVVRGELDEETRARLLQIRGRRQAPLRDDKAIASWNGLALAALAECGRFLGRDDWVDAGRTLAGFLLGPLSAADGRLHRTWRDGLAKGTGYLDDYANVANGLYELHVATGELRWLEQSYRLARLASDLFADEADGGFFQTPVDGEKLVARRKDLDDHPAPSGNAMLAYVLVRLGRIYGDEALEERAAGVFRLLRSGLERAPSAFGWALVSLDLHLAPRRELAIVGPAGSDVARAALARWDPRAVVAYGPADDVPLLAGKKLVGGLPAVYVCERFACRAPVVDPAEF